MKVTINSVRDIAEHKPPQKEYENWMADLKDPSVVKNITKNFQVAKVADQDMFTDKEMEWIYAYAFNQCRTVRHNDNGTIFISGNLQGVYEKFADQINEILPGADNSPIVMGNYFITPSQYGLHNDSTRQHDWENTLEETPRNSDKRKWVPWRNIIIPIFTAPAGTNSQAVFFSQRHVDYAHVYNHGVDTGQEIATTYPIVTDHTDIQFYDVDGNTIPRENNSIPYDKQHYDRYLYYTPYRRLTGLTPETTCNWAPKRPIVFDAVQLHATNKGSKENQWNVKMGLLLKFMRSIEE